MSNHTPGPWVWFKKNGNDFLVPISAIQSNPEYANLEAIVCDGSAYGEYGKTIHPDSANAKLIAAAPDLLTDLELAAETLRRYEALHRAKGTQESLDKADANQALAIRFETTIAKAKGETQ